MKDMEKKVYESPSIEIVCVETEGGFSMSYGGGDINDPTDDGQHLDFEIW